MANTKISELTDGVTANATDKIPAERSGANVYVTPGYLKTFLGVNITSGKTLAASNSLTLAGTDSTTMTFPSTSASIARTDAGQTFTGSQTISGGTVTASTPVLDMTQTWNSGGVTFSGLKFNITDTASAAGSLLLDLQVGGSSKFSVTKAGGISPINIYNTYTDASNYERAFIRYNSNVLEIGSEEAGTGSPRMVRFTSTRSGADTAWEFRSTGSTAPRFVIAGTDRSVTLYPEFPSMLNADGGFRSSRDYSAGAGSAAAFLAVNSNSATTYFGLIGSAAGVMQLNDGLGRGDGYGASIEMWEMTAPSAPATNGVRIYAEDNGSGKTRLMARFGSGAAQQIAIEP